MSYFDHQTIDYLYSKVDNPFSETVSLCHHCHSHIPALRYYKDDQVWMAKYCPQHGIMNHMIESDKEFYQQLNCTYDPNIRPGFWNEIILMEVTDRCNLDCPHCYHIPKRNITDIDRNVLIKELSDLKTTFPNFQFAMLAGAEATIRKDFAQLVHEVSDLGLSCNVMTNGVKFADKNFVKECISAGLTDINIGLNHPSYNNLPRARKKQELALDNATELGLRIGYISYTMNSMEELDDILEEITTTDWQASTYRIRYGSDIGTNPGQERLYLSDLYKKFQNWCQLNDKDYSIVEPCDNNIYHLTVNLEGRIIRLIQWCDETDIDLEELKSGPWCTFVKDGVTNFLHQIIRRDIFKNQSIELPDSPPLRYQYRWEPCTTDLNLKNLV